ncbi:MAG: c-type cytochrome [Thermoanaerobaculia bacterium]
MTNRRVLVIMVTVLVSLLLPMSVFADDAAAIYKAKCASCHAADGSGDTAMGKAMKLRDLRSADVQKQTDKELFTVTSDGKGKMPAYKAKLSEADINGLVVFMRGLAKK